MTKTEALLDCGATHNFIDPRTIKSLAMGTNPLKQPLIVHNVDGTINQGGSITHYCNLWVRKGTHIEKLGFYMANLGRDRLILGYLWFKRFNPNFNWNDNTLEGEAVEIDMAGYRTKIASRLQAVELTQESGEEEKKAILNQIPAAYHQYWEVFSEWASYWFPPEREEDHAIILKEGAPDKIDCKIYRQMAEELEATHQFITESLAKGYITDSKSPYASALFYRKKKDGKLRPIMDYRILNKWTVQDNYPLPLITNIIERLQGKTLFSKFDIQWGYNNIRIKKEDRWKAAFKTPFGLYEPTVMYFGLTNSPATFCRTMQKMLWNWLNKYPDKTGNYIDDMVVATKGDPQWHWQIVAELLDIFQQNSYFLQPAKCEFEVSRIECLGLVVDGNTLSIDPKKADGLHNWPRTLSNVKEVRSVLGVLGYQHPFIPHYANIARLLTTLTKKNQPFSWTPECRVALDTLIDAVTQGPTLAQPDLSLPFFLQVDASAYATGAILTQKDARGKHRAIGFLSKTFNEAKRNCNIHDREPLAVFRGLTHWWHLLLSSPHETTILTDHKNLEYYKEPHHINRRIARYVQRMQDYNFIIKHIPGESNKSDTLSRRPNYDQGTNNNTNVTILPPHLFVNTTTLSCLFARATTLSSIDEWVWSHQLRQSNLLNKWATTYPLTWTGELFWYGNQLVVVEDTSLKRGVISLYHDSPAAGHPGISNTTWAISRDFWWPAMKKDVTEYVKGCTECQAKKNQPTKPKPPPFPIPLDTYTTPFTSIAMDFIVKLPLSDYYNTILTITDTFSKASIFIPCNKTINAEQTAKLYATYVLPHYGLPHRIISDHDPRFTSVFSRELCRTLGITQNISTAYHPQTDGQLECTNQRLEQYLWIFIDYHQQNWASLLPLAQYTLNSWPNATTKKAPFELILGHIPRVHQTARPFKSPAVEDQLQTLKQAWEQAKEALQKAADIALPTRFKPYQIGDKVWLEGRNLNTTHPSSKLAPRRYGPFSITRVVSQMSYQLKLLTQWKLHDVFHATLLTPYRETTLNGQSYQEPAPDLINGQPEWEVESILRVRRRRNQLQFLIHWKGFSEAHDSWELARDIHTNELVEEFYKRHPLAIRSLPSPLTICSINMSTTPLSERIEDAPTPLSLADHLSSPPPSSHASLITQDFPLVPINTRPPSHAYTEPSEAEVDIGMMGWDLTTLQGFSMFDRTIPNHHQYGQKIEMPDSTSRWPHYIQFVVDTTTHNHYMYATQDDLHRVKYGWVLEAAPFTGCTSPGVDETDLQILLGSEDQCLGVDIALNTINDKGVTVDTDQLRELSLEDVVLTRREQELADECTRWRAKNAETRARLTKARVCSRVHPYLNHSTLIPDQYRLETMHTGGVTLATAIEDTHRHNLQWYTMPQYHNNDAQASHSTKPLPFLHRCHLCKQLHPMHTVWDCPTHKDCHYCKARDHTHDNCPNPHSLCFTKSECVIPFTHRQATTKLARRCPAAALHVQYYLDDWGYDGEDNTYNNYDWEA